MSTVAYLYRIKKQVYLWPCLGAIKEWYRQGQIVQRIIDKAVCNSIQAHEQGTGLKFYDIIKESEQLFTNVEAEVNLQLFQISGRWYFRVLESGYKFMNQWHEQDFARYVEPIFYDDRSDLEPGERKNKKFARAVDNLIYDRNYLMFNCVNWSWAHDAIWSKLRQARKDKDDKTKAKTEPN